MKKQKYRYFADTSFNPETGVSTAIFHTELGILIGKAKCCEEDKEHQSKFFGCALAEQRAWIKYFRIKRTRAKAQYNAIYQLYQKAKPCDAHMYGLMEEKLRELNSQIEEYATNISTLQLEIADQIKERDRAIKLDKRRKEKRLKNNISVNNEETH